jgi:hypothetical protein
VAEADGLERSLVARHGRRMLSVRAIAGGLKKNPPVDAHSE